MNKINKLINNSIKQNTDDWYSRRTKMITASNAGCILNYSNINSIDDLINQKKSGERIDNKYTKHGTYFEKHAKKYFEQINNVKVFDIGLVIHKKYPYIGASPDGVFMDKNNKLY